jgi:hypothetical protein
MDCNKGLMMTWQSFFTFISIFVVSIYNLTVESENSTLWTALLSSCLGYLLTSPTIKTKHVLPAFPLDRESVWPRNSTHPVTRPNAVKILYLCQSDFRCSVQIPCFRKFRHVMGEEYVSDWVADLKKGLNSLYMYCPWWNREWWEMHKYRYWESYRWKEETERCM